MQAIEKGWEIAVYLVQYGCNEGNCVSVGVACYCEVNEVRLGSVQ